MTPDLTQNEAAEISTPLTAVHRHDGLPHIANDDDQTNGTLANKLATAANFMLIGLGHGGLFLLTNCAGAMSLSKEYGYDKAAIPLGIAAGLAGALSNISQAPQASRQLFTFRPDLWVLTLATFFTIGIYASLPVVTATLQATRTIEETTDINFTALNPVLGTLATITTGIVFSVGLVNQISNGTTLLLRNHNKFLYFSSARKFINSQRSEAEYRQVISRLDKFKTIQTSAINIMLSIISLAPAMLLAWSISPEIQKGINRKGEIPLLKAAAPIQTFASSNTGSRIISLITTGLLNAAFAQDGLRTIPRDIIKTLETRPNKVRSIAALSLYTAYIISTTLTGAFQSKESGDSTLMVMLTIASVFIINWPGPRQNVFESKLAKCFLGKQTHFSREEHLKSVAHEKIIQNESADYSEDETENNTINTTTFNYQAMTV